MTEHEQSRSQQVLSILTLLVGGVICVLLVLVYLSVGKDEPPSTDVDSSADAPVSANWTRVGTHIMTRLKPSTVIITATQPPEKSTAVRRQRKEHGTGVIVSVDGHILTCHHVVDGATGIVVKLSDGRVLVAELISADAQTDLALLHINADQLPTIEWANEAVAKVGTPVWSLGNPFGLEWTLTSGIVSGIARAGLGNHPEVPYVQTDAATNPGSSGGPLVNEHGEVLGINTFILGNKFQGVSLAIPASLARDAVRRLMEKAD